ncbi:MAG TPA: hypothetical protein VNM90_05730 [Haliangium sp.]|nr:hypothetical protein [Haliangium sp.]
MTSAGYSGTPLMKKLGARPGMAALYIGVPETIEPLWSFADWGSRDVVERPPSRTVSGDGRYDFVHVFTKSAAELERALPVLRARLKPAGMIWVSWPKKAAKIPTDLTEDEVRRMALATGLVDIKVCAVDAVWSGLKLVIPVKDRG